MANTEEVEERTTPTTSTDIRTAVETAGSADESVADDDDELDKGSDTEAGDNAGGEDSDQDTEEDDSEDKTEDDESKEDADEKTDPKPSDKKDPEYRFTQFAGDGTPESYISNLEKAYENSSAEGINNHQKWQQSQQRLDTVLAAVSRDPDLADKLNAALSGNPSPAAPKGEAAPTDDPFIVHARNEWQQKSEKEVQEFIDSNPEVVSNPEIKKEVTHWMEVFSKEEYARNGRLMTGGEAMSLAYKHLGYEDKRAQRKSLSDAKSAVAPTRPQGSRKPSKKDNAFTDSQLNFAEAMGYSKDKLEKFAK